jgi:biofilm protein TabA
MIVTDINHIEHQVSMTPAFKKAIEFLRRPDIHNMADGRVEIDGQDVFALVQRYETVKTDTPKFEYHRQYIDIHYIVSGKEVIGWAPVEQMTITEAYDMEKDICFGTVPKEEITPVYLQAGQLAVLYTEDGHAPKLAADAPSHVVKIVVKVAAKLSKT